MKILYLAHRIPYPPNKGEKIRAYHQVKFLSSQHTVDLICLIDDYRDTSHVATLKKLCNRTYARQIKPLPSKIKGLATQFAGGTISVGYYHRAGVQRTFNRWIKESDYDVIFCFCSTMAEYVFRSPLYTRKTLPCLIMDFCDVDSDKWQQYADTTRPPMKLIFQREHKMMQTYEKRIHLKFDHSVFVSRQEADLFSSIVGTDEKITVVSNGIDAEYFSARNTTSQKLFMKKNGPVIVFTGAMDYHVNVDGVMWFCDQVLPLIKKNNPHIEFKIVGSNPTAAVKKLAQHEGVEVTGFVDDIRHYYAMADICVAPLRLGRGVQNKVLEAMAMEKAVVTTSRANAGIQASSGQHLLVADSPKGFAVAVNELIDNAQTRAVLGRAARLFVTSHFDWGKNLENFTNLMACKLAEQEIKTNHQVVLPLGAYGK